MTSTPTHAHDDQDVRDALSALRGATPEAHDLAALRRRMRTTAPIRRPALRTVGALAATTAAVGVGIALLPGTDEQGTRPLGVLATPSALASEVPPVRDGPYRYVRLRERRSYVTVSGDRSATLREDATTETWVSAGWKGRERTRHGAAGSTGDRELLRGIASTSPRPGSTSDGPYLYGDGPLATLDPRDLPTGAAAIAQTIREGIATNRWAAEGRGRGVPRRTSGGPSDDAYVGYSMAGLLVHARLTADQRAALLEVLRTDPHARSGGVGTDAEGREGRVIDLDYPGDQSLLGVRGLRIVYAPGSDEVLEWSVLPTSATGDQPSLRRTETILRSAYVGSTTARP